MKNFKMGVAIAMMKTQVWLESINGDYFPMKNQIHHFHLEKVSQRKKLLLWVSKKLVHFWYYATFFSSTKQSIFFNYKNEQKL